MRARGILLTVVLVVAVAVGGLWLWGRPRSHVAMPTAASSPEQVVRAYVTALDARDFDTSNALQPQGGLAGDHWWSVQAPTISNLKVISVRAESDADRANGAGHGYRQAVDVNTTADFTNWGGMDDGRGQPWTYILVRNSASERWRIADWGRL